MKKRLLAILLAFQIANLSASPMEFTHRNLHHFYTQTSWTSPNNTSVIRIDAQQIGFKIHISTDRLVSNQPASGINVNCHGSIVHVNAGSGDVCYVDTGEFVSWVDDNTTVNGAAGIYEIMTAK